MHWILERQDGRRLLQPHVYGLRSTTDYNTGQRVFEDDPDRVIELGFFVRGDSYRFWGLAPSNLHFFGPKDPGERVYFLGADRLGRDVLSRTIYATRVSMTIGLVGVGISLVLGIAIGGVSGYFRRYCRSGDPEADRVPAIPSVHPALDRTSRCHSANDTTDQDLFFHHGDPVDHWLDRACAGGARAVHGTEGRRFHQVRTPRRQPAGANHPTAHGAQLPLAHHCRRHAGDSGE